MARLSANTVPRMQLSNVTLDRPSGEPRGKAARGIPETYHGNEEWTRLRGQELGQRSQIGKDTDEGNGCDMGKGVFRILFKT